MKRKKISIIIPFNDIDTFHGGSRNGLKSRYSYFIQFLMLYESITNNWKRVSFNYDIIIIHSVPFNNIQQQIIDSIDIECRLVKGPDHPLKIRPQAYIMDTDCDYRLILDVDMLALREPQFEFTTEIQAMYGGNKYNKKQWEEICRYIGHPMPKQPILKLSNGSYGNWGFLEHFIYQTTCTRTRLFPYFNNGAILLKNSLSHNIGETWLRYRELYTKFVYEKQSIDIDLDGQDVIGLAISSVTKNWAALPCGFNFIIQEKFILGKILTILRRKPSLIHYINAENSIYYCKIIEDYRDIVQDKYNI